MYPVKTKEDSNIKNYKKWGKYLAQLGNSVVGGSPFSDDGKIVYQDNNSGPLSYKFHHTG